MAYELQLCDPYVIKMLEKYYTIHIKLMKEWGNFDEKEYVFQTSQKLFNYLPEGFL